MKKDYIFYVVSGFVIAILLAVFRFDEIEWPQKILIGILLIFGLGLCFKMAYHIFFGKKKAAS